VNAQLPAPFFQASGIVLHYGETVALQGSECSLERGQILCLLGPSGCGKTSLLRVIAGLERPAAGQLTLQGQNLLPVPTHQRGIGLMFQDFALFPHLNVAENVRFGLKMADLTRREQEKRTAEALTQVGMSAFAKRDVAHLSGGEKQRVALARSLAPQPKLLLLDEPLGSLDANTREQLVVEIRHLIHAAGLAAIYVTHDRGEAFAIADQIAVMNAGKILQTDEPARLYRAPRSPFVARFFGQENILAVLTQEGDRARTELGTFKVRGQPNHLLIHTDGVETSLIPSNRAIAGLIRSSTYRGNHYELRSVHHDTVVKHALAAHHTRAPQVGETVYIRIDPACVIPLADDG